MNKLTPVSPHGRRVFAWVIITLLFVSTVSFAPNSKLLITTTCAQADCDPLAAKPEVNPTSVFPHYPAGSTVYVSFDQSVTGVQNQLTAMLDAWNTANQTNGSGIHYEYIQPATGPAPNGEAPATLLLTMGIIRDSSGKPARWCEIRHRRWW